MFTILFSFWRRWFGGGYDGTWIGNNRGIQCVFFILLNYLLLNLNLNVTHFIQSCSSNIYIQAIILLALDIYLYAQFWSRGHGAPFDIGRQENPSADTIRRYNERWYHIPCDWLLKNHKYGFLYDFIYMGLRYTGPMIPLAFIDINFLWMGLLVSPIYAFCHTLNEREPWFFTKFRFINIATNLAEYIVGALYGFML